ncbi:MAG: SpoIIE family protein phosphatase [Phycisphaerales bacterium JB040]
MPREAISSTTSIRLQLVAGPGLSHTDDVTLLPPGPHVVGRGVHTDLRLPDPAVSRQHARFQADDARWTVTDLGSTHGTRRNGAGLTPGTPVGLEAGDQLELGPFLFRVMGEGTAGPTTHSIAATENPADRVETVPARELGPPAQQRLDLLIEAAAQLNSASDLHALAPIAARIAMQGAGYARAALVRPPGEDGTVEILASCAQGRADTPALSRSLLSRAAEGHFVRLTGDQPVSGAFGQSIADLGIHSALAAPVIVGDRTELLLYLDARGSESSVPPDAAAFVQAVARITGLAAASLARKKLELDRVQMRAELAAAREAQRLIMPPPTGRVGPVEYCLETIPGRHVAGDLFDLFSLADDPKRHAPGDPVACLLGDVSGKGLPAALTMASVQTHLRAALRYHDGDPAAAAREVNAAIFPQLTHGRFVTLWLAVIHPARHLVTYVDAGHGYAVIKPPGAPPEPVRSRGLYPMGVNPDAPYQNETLGLPDGYRLLLFSDGVVEQPGPDREQFGLERALLALHDADSPEDDVGAVRQAVSRHAGAESLADDFTLASLRIAPQTTETSDSDAG